MGKLDFEIYDDKTFADLLKEIHNNQKKKEKKIQILIDQLKPMVKELGDAMTIVPLIKDYLDISVKNDEHLIKMAQIIQRAAVRDTSEGDEFLSEEERRQLLQIADEAEEENKDTSDSKTDSTE